MATSALPPYGFSSGQIGPSVLADGSPARERMSRDSSLVTTDGHGRYAESAVRGKGFICVNSAAQALSLTGTTTYTGMVVYNAPGSNVNLVINSALYGMTALATGVGGVFLFYQVPAATLPTLTATNVSGSPFSTLLTGGGSSAARVASSCTLAANPIILRPVLSIPWITAVSQSFGVIKDEIAGELAVPPGGGIGFVAVTTALTGFAYLSWEEVPV